MRPFIWIVGPSQGKMRRPLFFFGGFLLLLIVVIVAFSLLFQYFMLEYEQEEHSFVNGLYWTITTMSTLGFGDITFASQAGRLFSGFVTLSGMVLLGILLPFGIIGVLFGPWLERRLRYRPPTFVPRKMAGHVIICGWDPITETLAKRLVFTGVPYVTLAADVDEVRRLEQQGVGVILGRSSDAGAYARARVGSARMVISNLSDPDNANVALTVASVSSTPVATVVTDPSRSHLLNLAGAAHAVPLRQLLGDYLAVRATTKGATSHVVDSLGRLLFAEMASHGTRFVGSTVRETGIRERTGASVIGIWKRGHFTLPHPDTEISDDMVLLLVGGSANLQALEELSTPAVTKAEELIIIAGYGAVGSAAADFLLRKGVSHIVIDNQKPSREPQDFILGDASDQRVLEDAGIARAGGLLVTTNDDGMNVFLTLAARHLNPHVRIVARASREENVEELYAAGADFVVSLSSVGANILANMIEGRQTTFLTEGVHIFWRPVPRVLVGRTLAEANLRSITGATVVAIQADPASVKLDVTADTVLEPETTLILVGTPESEGLFSRRFGQKKG